MFLRSRIHEPERLDDFRLVGPVLHRSLRELQRINRLFGNVRVLSRAVANHLAAFENKEATIVDLGCGSGDVLAAIAKQARRQKRTVRLIGLDANPHSLAFAEKSWPNYSELSFERRDIMAADFRLPPCDILISSHFLYHFEDRALQSFLRRQLQYVRHAAIFSELDRNFLALHFFKIVSLLLGFSPMTREDGRKAVRRSFKRRELEQILRSPGLAKIELQSKWAFRHLITLYPREE